MQKYHIIRIVCITTIAEISLHPGAHPARWGIVMARACHAFAAQKVLAANGQDQEGPRKHATRSGLVRVLMPMLLVVGCASWHPGLPIPSEVTENGVAAQILIPPGLNVNPTESVVKRGTPGQAPPPLPVPTTLALPDAIGFALENNP